MLLEQELLLLIYFWPGWLQAFNLTEDASDYP